MKQFKKMMPYVLVMILGIGFFYGMARGFGAQNTQFNPDVPGSSALAGGGLLTTIKVFINWVLGLLSLIALVVLLYGGFNMVTAAGDEAKYKKGFKILQQAAVGLAIIGLSWLIVSAIFWVIGSTATQQAPQ